MTKELRALRWKAQGGANPCKKPLQWVLRSSRKPFANNMHTTCRPGTLSIPIAVTMMPSADATLSEDMPMFTNAVRSAPVGVLVAKLPS